MTESPSALVERAALLLEAFAAGTTSGPWRFKHHPQCPEGPNVIGASGGALFSSACCGGSCYGYVSNLKDAAWIATLSPAVAPPLVEWLRQARDKLAWHEQNETDSVHLAFIRSADVAQYAPTIAFARLILGEA